MIIFITKSITPSYCLFWLILGAGFKAPAWKWQRWRGITRRAMVAPCSLAWHVRGPITLCACTEQQNATRPGPPAPAADPRRPQPPRATVYAAGACARRHAYGATRGQARQPREGRAPGRCQPAAVPMRHGQGSSQGRTTPQPRGNRTNFNQAGWSHPRFCVYRHGACSENDLNANENERACPTRKKRILRTDEGRTTDEEDVDAQRTSRSFDHDSEEGAWRGSSES